VDNFGVDNGRGLHYFAESMPDVDRLTLRIGALASAAAHLCSALRDLSHSECHSFADGVLDVLTAIDGEIASLESESGAAPAVDG